MKKVIVVYSGLGFTELQYDFGKSFTDDDYKQFNVSWDKLRTFKTKGELKEYLLKHNITIHDSYTL
jgi:hypothetical protein